MRDLGMTGPGSAYGVKEVDSLFIQMDKDSGELVLAEVSQALKRSSQARISTRKMISQQTAQKCRERANLFHDAVVKVERLKSCC